MLVATWNINGIKARIATLLRWLEEAKPDVCCLQEIKCEDQAFPALEIEALGYNFAVHGQKGFNGVAVLSKRPFEERVVRLPGDEDDNHSRYIETVVASRNAPFRVASIYLPNGNPVDTPKFPYKLAWMDRLIVHARSRLKLEEPLVLAGDFNVIPEERDARHPERWVDDALFQPETRRKFRTLLNLGLTETVRSLSDDPGLYTFWDYQAGAWQRNNGIRIDHLLLSPQAADRLKSFRIDKHVRGWDKPSDHVPVLAEFAE
ncbi:MAG: exodeoxyribonuclease III [Parvibaculaceae bacterium]